MPQGATSCTPHCSVPGTPRRSLRCSTKAHGDTGHFSSRPFPILFRYENYSSRFCFVQALSCRSVIFSARGCYVPHIFPRLVYHFCIPSLDRYDQAWSCCLECVPILRPNLRSSAAIALRTCVLFVSWSGEQAGPGRRQGGRRGRGESPGAAADSHGRLPREGRVFSRRRRRGHQQVISDIIHRLFCVLLSQHGATNKAVNSAVHVVPSMRLHPPKLRWCCSAFTLLVLSSLKNLPLCSRRGLTRTHIHGHAGQEQ